MDTSTLLARIDLQALAEEAGARWNPGKSLSSPCPLHGGSNPSAFHLYRVDTGAWRWHCFTNCPRDANDGDAITFYMSWRRCDFKTALAELAARVGIDHPRAQPAPSAAATAPTPAPALPPVVWMAKAAACVAYAEEQLWSPAGAAARDYLMHDRGLTDVTLITHHIGYNPADWRDKTPARWGLDGDAQHPVWIARGIVIPTVIADGWLGQVVYVNIRRPLPGDQLAARIGAVSGLKDVKYAGIKGGIRRMFGQPFLRGGFPLLLAEGEFDALLAWQELGDLVDVATIGGARMRLREDDAVRLLTARRILVAYDTDAAGDAGRQSLAALSERVTPITPPEHDLTDTYLVHGAYGLRQWLQGVLCLPSTPSPACSAPISAQPCSTSA